jgi:DNA-binding SARP family transcriptional activator
MAEIDLALASKFARGRFEALLESADVVGAYVDPERGRVLVAEATAIGPSSEAETIYLSLFRAEADLRCGRVQPAIASLREIPPRHMTGYPGFYIRVALCLASIGVVTAASDLDTRLSEARALIEQQGAAGIGRWVRLLSALAHDRSLASEMTVALWSTERGVVFANAEAILSQLGHLDEGATEVVRAAAEMRPERWLLGLRQVVDTAEPKAKWIAGRILETVGDKSDVKRLRTLSRELKGPYRSPAMGRSLSRRTADRVWVEDQGRIVLRIGSRVIPGTEVRRRPLALLCFLLTRPGMSATRDQVLDALWPESDPSQAVNSLHQTIYFLRRVIEPAYSDDLSPGYVNQDGELVWLDTELISSRSVRCKETLRNLGSDPATHEVLAMAADYRGRFALDFSYEDWATVHRESLHARYLEVMERAIATASAGGRFADAMELSRATLETDPSLDHIQASLVKFYGLLGAHAAAAEQYQHYSSVMREEFGLEPTPLDQL